MSQAHWYISTKTSSVIKFSWPHWEKIYWFKSENTKKYAFLHQTLAELENIKRVIEEAEAVFINNPKLYDVSFTLWTWWIIRLFSLFHAKHAKYNKAIKDKANIEDVWSKLSTHRNKDLAHKTSQQSYPSFWFFIEKENISSIEENLKFDPKTLSTSYPPFSNANDIVTQILNRLIYCFQDEIEKQSQIVKKELLKEWKDLLKQPELQMTIKKSGWDSE